MKIRHGFVSNSSTTSFCIYGICISGNKESEELAADQRLSENNIDYWYEPHNGDLYVGKSWSCVKDDQTGKEFKEEVEKIMKEVFGEEISLSTYNEGWRDD